MNYNVEVDFDKLDIKFIEHVNVQSRQLTEMIDDEESFMKLVDQGVVKKINGVDFFEFAVIKGYRKSVEHFLRMNRLLFNNDIMHRIIEEHPTRVESLKILIDNGFDVDLTDKTGRRLVEIAINEGANDMLKALLDAGAEIEFNIAHENLKTPFLRAIQLKNFEIISSLIDAKCDVNAVDKYNQTVAHYIANNYSLEYWYSEYRDVYESLKSKIENCQKIADKVLPLCSIETMNKPDRYGLTPIFHALRSSYIGKHGSTRLIKAKADINKKISFYPSISETGTILEFAIFKKISSVIQHILHYRPDLLTVRYGRNVLENCLHKDCRASALMILKCCDERHLDMINNAIKYAERSLPLCSKWKPIFIKGCLDSKKRIKKKMKKKESRGRSKESRGGSKESRGSSKVYPMSIE